MIVTLKAKLFNTEEKQRLLSNILSLGVLQGANYLLPLLTLPYLVRVLGPEYFGLLAFVGATIAYLSLITDYGFNLSATRQISIHRNNQARISDIFCSVMIIKVALMLVSFLLMALLVFSVETFRQYWQVYFVTFGAVIGQVLFPVWFFQGMEKMKYITYLNLMSKTFFTLSVFIFVQEKTDYIWVPILTSTGYIAAGIGSLYIIKKEFFIDFKWQNWQLIKYQLIDGWHVFFSSIAISLYTVTTIFIVGLFVNSMAVGYFSAADKIIQALKGLYTPVSQAIYPLIGKKMHENRLEGLAFVRKVMCIVGSVMFFVSLIVFFYAEQIVGLLLGEQYMQSVVLLKIMAFLPFVICISNFLGVQFMLNIGLKKEFSVIVLLMAIFGMLNSVFFISIFKEGGAAFALLITEILVTVLFLIIVRKRWKDVG